MATPYFTIVVTTHKRYEFLERAVGSILKQTYANNQMIIVCDVIDNDTLKICHKLRKNDMFILKEGAVGPAESRNIGIHNAKGNFILFLDDDDAYEADFLERVSHVIVQPDYKNEILYTNSRTIFVSNSTFTDTKYMDLSHIPFEQIYVKNFIHSNAIVYPTELIRNLLFDAECLYEDWDFVLQASLGNIMKHIPIYGPLVYSDRTIVRRNCTVHEKLWKCYVRIYKKNMNVNSCIHKMRMELLCLDEKRYNEIFHQ